MRSLYSLLLLAVATGSSVAAEDTYPAKTRCATRYGPEQVLPKSSGYHSTVHVTYTKKVAHHPVETITPRAKTKTVTRTKTSTITRKRVPTRTVTAVKTETETDTVVSTVQSFTGSLTTVTNTPVAVTIPTPAGFTAIKAQADYAPKKRSPIAANGLAVRGRGEADLTDDSLKCPPVGQPNKFSPPRYPTATYCTTIVRAATTKTRHVTVGHKTRTTTLPCRTVTRTAWKTVTSTTFSRAAASLTTSTSTTTTTTTETSFTTSVSTLVTTVIEQAPVPTHYAQCDSNNILGAVNGNHGIYQPVIDGSTSRVNEDSTIRDAANCCARCAQEPFCIGYAQYPNGACYYFTPKANECTPSMDRSSFYYSKGNVVAPNKGYIVGNGQCGRLRNAGDLP